MAPESVIQKRRNLTNAQITSIKDASRKHHHRHAPLTLTRHRLRLDGTLPRARSGRGDHPVLLRLHVALGVLQHPRVHRRLEPR